MGRLPDDTHKANRLASPAALRPMNVADVDAVARIWREGWVDAHVGHVPAALVAARTASSFTARAGDHLAGTIVATRDDSVAGFVMIDHDQVDQLYLDRAARGSGIGSALLGAAERAILVAGHRRAWLAVATGNTGGRRFYERQGWVDEGPFLHQAPVPGGRWPSTATVSSALADDGVRPREPWAVPRTPEGPPTYVRGQRVGREQRVLLA